MGRRMLMKYREQLSGMGTWPPPDFSDEGREAKVEFKRHGAGRYLIHVDHKAEGEIFKMQDGAWGARFKAGSAFSFSDAAANHSSLLKDLKNQVRETVKRNNSDQLSHEPEGDLNAQV